MRGEKTPRAVADPSKPRPEKARTPVMQQFDDAKRAYPDALIFFRLGDFYELFYEDAVFASGFLGLTLTARHKGTADEAPMAGVPHHAAHGYIAALAAGRKVALCAQLADPSKVKGIVPREVVRVLTPGLVTSGELDAREHNWLAAIEGSVDDAGAVAYGFALLDSTGALRGRPLGSRDALRGGRAPARARCCSDPPPRRSPPSSARSSDPSRCDRTARSPQTLLRSSASSSGTRARTTLPRTTPRSRSARRRA
ncbi:MAG: hypothetical protein U0414_43910 [Polyangiaceae bacterium]